MVRASCTWTGLAGSGRVALIDHRDAAEAGLRVLSDPALWGAHHDLTGPVPLSWPEALELLSAELGESVTFRVAAEPQFLVRPISAGIPAGEAELLITREWAILAGENDYTTDSFQQIIGRSPRPLAEFLHENRENSGSPDMSVGQVRPGRAGRWPPRASMARAIRASGFLNPKAMRVRSRILVLVDSMSALDRSLSRAALISAR